MKTKYHIESVDELLELIKHHNGLPSNIKDEDPKLPDSIRITLGDRYLELKAEGFFFETYEGEQTFIKGICEILGIDVHLT